MGCAPPREGPLLVLVGFPDVEHERPRGGDGLGRARGVHLADVGLGRLQQISERWHSPYTHKPYPASRHSAPYLVARGLPDGGAAAQDGAGRFRGTGPFEMLDRILANAAAGPSAGFSQGWAFVVLEGPRRPAPSGTRSATPSGGPSRTGRGWFGRRSSSCPSPTRQPTGPATPSPTRPAHGGASIGMACPYWLVDTSFATMLILLSAVDAGLGALFSGLNHHDDELMAALGVPAGIPPDRGGVPRLARRPRPAFARR